MSMCPFSVFCFRPSIAVLSRQVDPEVCSHAFLISLCSLLPLLQRGSSPGCSLGLLS
jgi:hypothetical protein